MTTQEVLDVTHKLTGADDLSTVSLDADMKAVEDLMLSAVASDVSILRDASHHILEAGGKRIRPRMVLLTYLAAGGRNAEKTVPVAAAVELVHTASVVHDDINDHGVTRRGRPSVNSIWGRTFALLTGDFLFTKVYELMAPFADLNIVLAEATVALVEGETLQAAAVKENNLSRQVYYDIIARKTAALFKAGAKLGALMADAPHERVEALGRYGFNVGLAFQIIDDILDLLGDERTLGKTTGLDAAQGKGIGSVVDLDAGDPMVTIRNKVMNGDAIVEGRRQAETLVQAALAELSVLPDTPYRALLAELAHSTIERDR
jgi:geranylgeranyl pyrophosphate synthase